MNLTLRIATELHLKRLVVGGFERVYEMGRIFRNEGISTRHNPEFTSVEVYQAYADVSDMLELTEQMICYCCERANGGKLTIQYGDEVIDLGNRPWRRAPMNDLVMEATGVDVMGNFAGDLAGAKAAAEAALRALGDKESMGGIPGVQQAPSVGHVLNEMFEATVETKLRQPTFVLDHPKEISPLAKPHRSKPGVTERFELFIVGRELANSFSELTDPVDQRERLESQIETHKVAQEGARAAAEAKGVPHRHGRGLCHRAGVRHAPDRGDGPRRGQAGDAAHEQRVDPRRHRVPLAQEPGLSGAPKISSTLKIIFIRLCSMPSAPSSTPPSRAPRRAV